MNFDEMRKRYMEDAHFHHSVDFFHKALLDGHWSISEMRDAVTFAAIKFESENVRPILFRAKENGKGGGV